MAMSHLLVLVLALLSALPPLTSSAAATSGSTLTQSRTLSGNQTLASPSDAFRLGLFPASNRSRWFLGIWFTVSPDTVVWVANRDRPLTTSSAAVEVTAGGFLALRDAATNETVWSSSNSSAGAAAAELRDTGNLVLTDASTGAVVWQSFEHPSNTFLPEMRVGRNLRTGAEWSLSSWRAADDPSPGSFRYVMSAAGAPELHVWSGGRKTYRTGPWNGARFSGIPEMTTFEDMFEFQFTDDAAGSGEVSYMFRNRDGSPLSRVLLNESGVMQRMVWDEASEAWSNFWSGPRDQCDAYARCGAFGVCDVGNAVVCGCAAGFAPRSPAEWYMRNNSGGCARRTPLRCAGAGGGDGFYVLRGVKLPDTGTTAVDAGATMQECARRCLENCNCTAYAAADIRGGGSGCIQWFGDLVDMRYVDSGQDLYVKLAKSDLPDAPKNTRRLVAVITMVVTGFVLLLLSLAFVIWRKARHSERVAMLDDAAELMSGECPTYPMGTIRTATNGFCRENIIGRGGFGVVYKGQLPDGQQVAVKKLCAENTPAQGRLNEFMNEVVLIANLQHRNLVRLLGCCVHCSERMLVYEYMSNKSLDAFIFDERRRASLSWKARLDIILGIARGVLYLHQDSRLSIVHRDLKAANVLLDADMVAKISDFGIARLFSSSADRQETITRTIIGTYGYMAPEYAMDGTVSFMQDVYSFGVLLLEIVSGRRNQRSFNLIAHAWGLWEGDRSQDLTDPAIRGGCTAGELAQAAACVQVALLCVQDCPSRRPPMADVIPMLLQQKTPARPQRPVVCSNDPAAAALAVQAEMITGGNELTITGLEGR
ncbi:unnamed protein product [Urochloa decumbens]|uniref:Receptor-like serine/threonine-protein kinase n=1 Tax=Urochloa decumbens TaxID=240449 RepID=A0ABC9GAT9_9POAL